MRKEIIDALTDALKNSGVFKVVYKGVLPSLPSVKSFPAIAIAIDKENRERINVPGCQFQSELTIIGIIYNRTNKTTYEDVLSDLLQSVENTIQTDETLNDLVIDIFVKDIAQDAGLLHPYQLAELHIIAYFRN